MEHIIRIMFIAFISILGLTLNMNLSTKAQTLHYLKEDLEVAAHDATLEVLETELAKGKIVFDQTEARNTFRESFENNSRLTADDYTLIDLVFLDHSTVPSFPTTYISSSTDFSDVFTAPTIIGLVQVNKDAYFRNNDTETFTQVASYSYKLNSTINEPSEIIGSPNAQGFVWTVPYTQNITSSFGYRTHPITNIRTLHAGTDIAQAGVENSPVVSAKEGTVIFTGPLGSYGNLVVIDHGNGIETRYAHLALIQTSTGNSVTAGQVIGLVGSTGGSTGPHLHLEIRIDGKPYDPLIFYP